MFLLPNMSEAHLNHTKYSFKDFLPAYVSLIDFVMIFLTGALKRLLIPAVKVLEKTNFRRSSKSLLGIKLGSGSSS